MSLWLGLCRETVAGEEIDRGKVCVASQLLNVG